MDKLRKLKGDSFVETGITVMNNIENIIINKNKIKQHELASSAHSNY
jgi:hypothetical protein